MVTLRDVRALALALPEATEEDHHGMASFRVRGRIFGTVPDARHVRLMVGEEDVLAACVEASGACEQLRWGARLAGVVVELRTVPAPLVAELLESAWRRRPPAALVRARDEARR